MATRNNALGLIRSLNDIASSDAIEQDRAARREALRLSKELVVALEEPASLAAELTFRPLVTMAARVAVDMELFAHIEKRGPITAAQLAELTDAEELLISRILRPLTATGFVDEVGEYRWKANELTKAMAVPAIASGHKFIWEVPINAAAKLPRYFKEAGYQCPTEPKDGAVQYAFQTKLPFFEFVGSVPAYQKDFNLFMGSTLGVRKYWPEWFPVQERLINGASKDKPLVLDVGGGKGHDLQAFAKSFPGWKLVLLDLEHVVATAEGPFEKVPYDFFTAQPICGARAIYMHHCLHDWSDVKAREILKAQRASMTPEYSKLLIHEMILSEEKVPLFHALLDVNMMVINGGMERSRKQWSALLGSAGFEVVKFWAPEEEDDDGIVEAVPV